MLLKPCALLLLIAVAVVVAQDAAPATRQRTNAASRRTKLFEEQQQQQAEKATAAGQRRRLVSKTRVPAARVVTTAAPTAAPTTTTTEAPATESFDDVTVAPQIEDEHEEPLPVFRPRPAAVRPAPVQETVEFQLPAFKPRTARPPVVVQQVVEEEELEEEEPVQPIVRQKPVAGPTRTRTQAAPTSRPVQAERVPQQSTAPALVKPAGSRTTKEREPTPVVETVRQYSFEGDDGSFTFGYENADGSFKEETRGADCIVRGKYGYIDPDGVKREFNYQTGNQCVPGEKSEEEEEEEEEERPATVRRPNVPQRRPNVPERRPAPVVVQQEEEIEDEEREVAQVLSTPTRITKPAATPAPQRVRPAAVTSAPQTVRRPTFQQTDNSNLDFESEVQRLSGQQVQQQVQQQRPAPRPVARPIFNDDDDEEAFVERRPVPQAPLRSGQQSFSTELTFDRNNNQFSSSLSQRIPDTNEEISIREKLGGFVFNPFTTTTEFPIVRQQIPQQQQPSLIQIQQNQNQFSQNINDQERNRQASEARRQQLETERLQQEAQRIAEENAAAQRRPAVVSAPVQQQQQFDFSGFSQQRFQPQQQPTFGVAPQRAQQNVAVPVQQRPTFASGQIDSFLSSLGK